MSVLAPLALLLWLTSTFAQDYNVLNYGAKGDGIHDDSGAVKLGWRAACNADNGTLLIPRSFTFLLKPLILKGPCKFNTRVVIAGDIIAPRDLTQWNVTNESQKWINFKTLTGLRVIGEPTGKIDGNGKQWWDINCKRNPDQPCKTAPAALTFTEVQDLQVLNLTVVNSPRIHVVFSECQHVIASGITIDSPASSPNTDGIHVTKSQYVRIENSSLSSGDDCISIVAGSSNIVAKGIKCGPGHGISIGSLGNGLSDDVVTNVTIDGAIVKDTSNGVRIKTYKNGRGLVENIVFKNIQVTGSVTNPIIIDQNYCDSAHHACQGSGNVKETSAVKIKNVLYSNIQGVSSPTNCAVQFKCSAVAPCEGIQLREVNLTSHWKYLVTEAECENEYVFQNCMQNSFVKF